MRMKIPSHWKEEDYRKAVNTFLQESSSALNKGKFDESAKLLIAAATIIKSIPQVKRKEIIREKNNRYIKAVRERQNSKPEDETTVIKKKETSSPFETNE
jgi:hypothetical protein